MTRESVINSNILKKRFIRDCSLPITVYDNPYFIQRLETIDTLFHCLKKFDRFCEELKRFRTEQEYLAWYNETKDRIIQHIRENEAYKEFNMLSPGNTQKEIGKNNLYIEQNDRRLFISIDMNKANFTSMRYYSPRMFDGCGTWEEYVGIFTDSKHFADSKYIRQVIFGALNPKRQMKYESFLMQRIYDSIKKECPKLGIFSLGEDEIIIQFVQHSETVYSLSKIENAIPADLRELVRVEVFSLKKIGTYGWMKTFMFSVPQRVEYKCVDAEIFHQLVKHRLNEIITEDDLVFYHNGQLAKFLKEVENPCL